MSKQTEMKLELLAKESTKPENNFTDPAIGYEIDMSEGMAVEMFGISNPEDEVTHFFSFLCLPYSIEI